MATTQNRRYELTYLLPGSLTDNEVAQARRDIEALLKKHKASVIKDEDWGRKQLAYVIKANGQKNVDAVYTHLVIEMPPAAASLLDRDVLLSAKVIRHLLVVSDDTQTESEEASAEK